jgi:hypothetical protein
MDNNYNTKKSQILSTPLGLPQDFISNQLIAVSGGMADKPPFQTSTDGNCLFNSASIATFGDQTKAAKLCVLTLY